MSDNHLVPPEDPAWIHCSECGMRVDPGDAEILDDHPYCPDCAGPRAVALLQGPLSKRSDQEIQCLLVTIEMWLRDLETALFAPDQVALRAALRSFVTRRGP